MRRVSSDGLGDRGGLGEAVRLPVYPSDGLGGPDKARDDDDQRKQHQGQKDASVHRFSFDQGALRHRIVATGMKGMTPRHAADPQPGPLQGAVPLYSLISVTGAAGREATLREHQMRQRELIQADQAHDQKTGDSKNVHLILVAACASSSRSTAKVAAYASRRARTTRSTDGRSGRVSRRRISRMRRRN